MTRSLEHVEHPTEDALVLYVYGEEGERDRDAIAEHLLSCPTCQTAAAEMDAFRRVSTPVDVPDPGPDLEDRVWARVQAECLPVRRMWSVGPLGAVAAWAAAVALVVVTGAWWTRQTPVVPGDSARFPQTGSATDVRERVLFTALDAHLGNTEMLLVELLNTPGAGASLDFEREVAVDLLHSGRLYRVTAAETGHIPFASVLDEVETVLVDFARAPEDDAGSELAALRDRIAAGDLLFKVRAAARDVRERTDNPVRSGGGTL
jgi:hypothetical protein